MTDPSDGAVERRNLFVNHVLPESCPERVAHRSAGRGRAERAPRQGVGVEGAAASLEAAAAPGAAGRPEVEAATARGLARALLDGALASRRAEALLQRSEAMLLADLAENHRVRELGFASVAGLAEEILHIRPRTAAHRRRVRQEKRKTGEAAETAGNGEAALDPEAAAAARKTLEELHTHLADVAGLIDSGAPRDPFDALDRLLSPLRVFLGRILRHLERTRSLRMLGYTNLRVFAEETLHLSERTAQNRIAETDLFGDRPLLEEAYGRGEIGTVAAHLLHRLATERNLPAHLERAKQVTVRQLEREFQFWKLLQRAGPSLASRFPGPFPMPGLEAALIEQLCGGDERLRRDRRTAPRPGANSCTSRRPGEDRHGRGSSATRIVAGGCVERVASGGPPDPPHVGLCDPRRESARPTPLAAERFPG